ncbi:MAG: dihydroorotase family protein [Candidatus ainarchaeum sp.]|nr:dihydroorotase family protein [Candidatus ainarchaeum sp.]
MGGLALLNGKVFVGGAVREANVFTKGGKIARIARSSRLSGEKAVDCTGLLVLPGVVDSHVHFREPGQSHKEDWATGSMAAAAGGVTTVIDMPNNNPPATTAKRLAEKAGIAGKRSVVDFRLHFGAVPGNRAEIAKARGIASVKVFMGSSTGGLLLRRDEDVLEAFKAAKRKGVPATVHAEDDQIVSEATRVAKESKWNDPSAHLLARPVSAAVLALWRAVLASAKAGSRLHILHVSSEAELLELSEARALGSLATCEVTPHHLFLDASRVRLLGSFAKVNPPIRSDRDRTALLRALESGFIDTVASDHAPHTREEKRAPILDAPSGVPGVQTLLPLLLNECSKGSLSLARAVEAASSKPARIFSLGRKGRIAEGMDADLAVVDLRRERTIRDEDMLYKCGWTPFHGMAVKGTVEKTVSRGKLVFEGL